MKISQYVNLVEVVELMLDAVCVVDESDHFVYVSPAFEQIFGYAPKEVIGHPVLNFVYHDDRATTLETIDHLVSGEPMRSFENRWVHKSGRVLTILWSARYASEHKLRIAVAHDITERKKMEEKLKYLASYDSLTQLPNRSLMKETLGEYLKKARRTNAKICVLFLDINEFKQVNDSYGHLVGDQLLEEVAKRLLENVGSNDVVGRLGGDEFLIILDNVGDQKELNVLVEALHQELNRPIEINSDRLQISLSIGTSCYPEDGETEEQLMHVADA